MTGSGPARAWLAQTAEMVGRERCESRRTGAAGSRPLSSGRRTSIDRPRLDRLRLRGPWRDLGRVALDDAIVAGTQPAHELDHLEQDEERHQAPRKEAKEQESPHAVSLWWTRLRGWGHRRPIACNGLADPPARAHESARRNWWGPPFGGPVAANKSAVSERRRVPRSPALRPANLVPGAVRGITPPTGLAVQPAPSGKTKITGAPFAATMGLSTNLSRNRENLSPTSGLMWMVCGYTRGGGTAHGSSACPHHDRAGWLGSTVR